MGATGVQAISQSPSSQCRKRGEIVRLLAVAQAGKPSTPPASCGRTGEDDCCSAAAVPRRSKLNSRSQPYCKYRAVLALLAEAVVIKIFAATGYSAQRPAWHIQ